ncbi:MAG: discoidin domain-containing protein [Nitrospirae bacterium]|nr:discoidin domain-containing protein [Nitrospirota bacterium]
MKARRIFVALCLAVVSIALTCCKGEQTASKPAAPAATPVAPSVAEVKEGKPADKPAEAIYSTSVSGHEHGVNKVFDQSVAPNDFWEAAGYPQWIKIAYIEAKELKGYELITGELPIRMPKDWRFYGSNDDINWILLDKQSGQSGWKVNEKRTYNIEKPVKYKYYRFDLTDGNAPEAKIFRIYEITLL